LAEAAKYHANDLGPKGLMSHDSSDGTTAGKRIDRFLAKQKQVVGFGECMSAGMTSGKDVVLQLLVDDGVKSRGHRANMTNPAFIYCGCYTGTHTDYSTITVIDYGFQR